MNWFLWVLGCERCMGEGRMWDTCNMLFFYSFPGTIGHTQVQISLDSMLFRYGSQLQNLV